MHLGIRCGTQGGISGIERKTRGVRRNKFRNALGIGYGAILVSAVLKRDERRPHEAGGRGRREGGAWIVDEAGLGHGAPELLHLGAALAIGRLRGDRKSTRLNS